MLTGFLPVQVKKQKAHEIRGLSLMNGFSESALFV